MFSLLYMRSVSDDLTARARIRDAAIAAFARDGFDATSLRSIARDAGVSAALIVHHFGDKSTLRDECDAHVVSIFIDEDHVVIEAPTQDRIRAAMHDIQRYGPYIDYLGRMLLDGSAAADHLFDRLLSGTRAMFEDHRNSGMLEPLSDPEMTVLLVTLIGLGPVIMRAQIARALGSDQLSPAGLKRMTVPTLELLTHGIYSTTDLLDSARAALADDGAAEGATS